MIQITSRRTFALRPVPIRITPFLREWLTAYVSNSARPSRATFILT